MQKAGALGDAVGHEWERLKAGLLVAALLGLLKWSFGLIWAEVGLSP